MQDIDVLLAGTVPVARARHGLHVYDEVQIGVPTHGLVSPYVPSSSNILRDPWLGVK